MERGSWTFHPLWIKLGLAAFAVTLVTTLFIRVPLLRRMQSTDSERRRLGPVLGFLSWFELTVLYLTVAGMVTEPSGADTGTLAAGGAILAVVAAAALASAIRILQSSEVPS